MKKLFIAILLLTALAVGGAIYFASDTAKENAKSALVDMGSQALDTATAKAKAVGTEAVEAVKEKVASATDTAEKLTDKTTAVAKEAAENAATKVAK